MAVPLLNFESGPGVLLLIFSGSCVPLLNFEGSWVSGSLSHFFTMPKDSARFERVIQVKLYFYEILRKIQTKEERLQFLKT